MVPRFSISLELLEIENNELPDRFKSDPNAKALFDNASDQINEFIVLTDNSLLATKLDKEIKSRSLDLTEVSGDIEKVLRKENILIAAKSYFDKKLNINNESFLNQLFEMNSREDIFIEIKNKKVFRFNQDTQMTQELIARIFSLKKRNIYSSMMAINFF